MLSTIPFAGFYNSIHDSLLDQAMSEMFMDDYGDSNDDLIGQAFGDCNWQMVHNAYAKEYAEQFAKELKLDITFESLQSPREYNFTTDRIFVHISEDEIKRLIRETKRETFEAEVAERFTSRSGFISSYPNDLNNWPKDLAEWDHNHVGTLIAAYAKDNWDGGSEAEMYLMESAQGNGRFTQWIEDATPSIDRLYKIADYLKTRKERES